jgi:hypothetical protein
VVLAGDVHTFDAEAYTARLAARLPGVSAADISLIVTEGSIVVEGTIHTHTLPRAQAVREALGAMSAASLGSIISLTVESVATPTLSHMVIPAPSPTPLPPPASSTPPDTVDGAAAAPESGLSLAIIGAVGAGGALVGCIGLVCIYVLCCRDKRAKPSPVAQQMTTSRVAVHLSRESHPPPPQRQMSSGASIGRGLQRAFSSHSSNKSFSRMLEVDDAGGPDTPGSMAKQPPNVARLDESGFQDVELTSSSTETYRT